MDFAFTFVNGGDDNQEWNTEFTAEFDLAPDETRPIQINIDPTRDLSTAITVDAAGQNATCTLRYTAADQRWRMQTVTPNVFNFNYSMQNRNGTLACTLPELA